MAVQKKYVCAFCARAFTRLEHKQRHERSHTNEKPFHCVYCTSAFVRRDLLQRHCRTVHSINLSTSHFKNESGKFDDKLEPKVKPVQSIEDTKVPEQPVSPVVPVRARANSIGSISLAKHDPNAGNDLINLLSICKKLNQTLTQFDDDIAKVNEEEINEAFLIGYVHLSSTNEFPVFDELLKELVLYLNSHYINEKLSKFKLVSIYAILATGYNINGNEAEAVDYFNKAWNLLTLKLIPLNYNNNNLLNQLAILHNLFLLTFIYLEDDLGSKMPNYNLNLTSDLIFNYLNDISTIILNNLIQDSKSIASKNHEETLLYANLNLFWSIYIYLSNYFVSSFPPKFYNMFLDQILFDGKSLKSVMINLSKSIVLIESKFLKDIIICTLINELNYLIHYNNLLIYDLKNSLHNSIILVNKSLINLKLDNKIFELFKKKVVVNSPLKFKDLLDYYIFRPNEKFEINLLYASLKEFNFTYNNNSYKFNFNRFILNNLKVDLYKFSNDLLPFFVNPITDLNNNLGIISFPLIFNHRFLNKNFGIIDFKPFSQFTIKTMTFLVIEWYLTIFKILTNAAKNLCLANNYILQCLLYLLNHNNFDFKFNDPNWFLDIFKELENIFHLWLNFINTGENLETLRSFKVNLKTFTSNYVNSNVVGISDDNYTFNKTVPVSTSSSTSSSSNNSNPGSALLTQPPLIPLLAGTFISSPDPGLGGFRAIILPKIEPEPERKNSTMLPPILSNINSSLVPNS